MTLYLSHFDTKLRQDLQLQEPIKHCLAEYLFPDAQFALGEINPQTVKVKDLRDYQGMSLQFSARKRLYFSDRPLRDLLYPNPSDGAAYGSLPFTPCQNFSQISQARVLIIDDNTGENNGILPQEQAKKLVGDCHGKLSLALAEQLTGKKNAPFQFRLGIRPQENCKVYRIAKGTLAPDTRLGTLTSTVVHSAGRTKVGYDLLLPISSFKGRKGIEAIQPGEYFLDIGLGIKTIAEYGKQSLGAQVLVNYPKGVEADITPILTRKAAELAEKQSDLHTLAQYFVKTYEERTIWQEEQPLEDGDLLSPLDALAGEDTEQSQEKIFYDLLKHDLEHHGQLLEHPYVIDELKKFLQRQWIDIATGRAIKFESALAQPSLYLQKNEVCVPRMPDGAELIVTRSPLVNSNGVILLTNRHLPQLMRLEGTIHIHPETAAQHLQADFDGDRLAFEQADKYPSLSAEIKEALLPENRYPDVVKRDKLPYQGNFEEIAVSAVNNDIGKIANQIMMAVTLRWETIMMPEEKKAGYVQQVAQYYRDILNKEINPKSNFQIPETYRKDIEAIANLPLELSSQEIETTLKQLRDIQFQIVGDLSNELQVAVDGPKSALRPNQTLLNACRAIGGYQPVPWLAGRDKSRNPQLYRTHTLDSRNYGPVDRMIVITNDKWQKNRLVARPTMQFRGIFPDVNHPQLTTIAQEIKETYNHYLKSARSLEDLKSQQPELMEPYLEVTSSKSQKTIYLTKLEKFGALESDFLNKDKPFPLDLRLVSNTINRDIPHSLLAITAGKADDNIIGAVALSSVEAHKLKTGIILNQGLAVMRPGITDERIEGIYHALNEYVSTIRQEHPETERQVLAAALWHHSHTRDQFQTKKALLAFKLFPNEVIQQLKTLQLTELKMVGLHFPTNEYGNRQWRGEVVNCEIAVHPLPDKSGQFEDKRVIKVEGKVLAPLTSESPAFAVGTQFQAAIIAEPSSGAIATTPQGNTLKIGQIKSFAYRERDWQGEETKITVALVNNGRGREVPLVSLDGNALGVLDRESEGKLKERNLLTRKGLTLVAKLENSPPTTAHLHVKPETVVYPWQQNTQEQEMQAKRAMYREYYQIYRAEVLNDTTLNPLSPSELDRAIALRAYADHQNPQDIATILSQSDVVLDWRETIPQTRTWEEYVNQAKEYIRVIQNEAYQQLQQQEAEISR